MPCKSPSCTSTRCSCPAALFNRVRDRINSLRGLTHEEKELCKRHLEKKEVTIWRTRQLSDQELLSVIRTFPNSEALFVAVHAPVMCCIARCCFFSVMGHDICLQHLILHAFSRLLHSSDSISTNVSYLVQGFGHYLQDAGNLTLCANCRRCVLKAKGGRERSVSAAADLMIAWSEDCS